MCECGSRIAGFAAATCSPVCSAAMFLRLAFSAIGATCYRCLSCLPRGVCLCQSVPAISGIFLASLIGTQPAILKPWAHTSDAFLLSTVVADMLLLPDTLRAVIGSREVLRTLIESCEGPLGRGHKFVSGSRKSKS